MPELQQMSLILLPIPLSLAYPYFPAGSPLIHLWSILWSCIFHIHILHLPWGYTQLVGQTIGTWFAVKWFRSTGKGKAYTWVVVASNMAVLAINHSAPMITDIDPDITLAEMVIVMKLTLFTWACHDGAQDGENLDAQQRKDRLVDVPDLLALLGYV